MTLTELLPAIRKLSLPDRLQLFRLLAEEFDLQEDIAPLKPFKVYYLSTPYNSFGAGTILMQVLNENSSMLHQRLISYS
ncbi:MAG TPA: hypothetical protein IGS17_15895 [Oscillatoriales cyanobacterium M59_W2019_021]|nr:MAG: hypothetical protein D6728_09820 [Cyanobacteria bacterium J055]HIK33363.1 hypothetical protein [Oscillatoriales cyanobacterium M4454_W2019_049]HIK52389.1 hypothetical protein [Oscillatoriales cyanobacterium M59_W2019_021]